MKKWGPFVLTFLAGLLIGTSIGWRICDQRKMGGRSPEVRNQRMVKMLAEKLDLTPEQREKIVKILDDKRQKAEGMRDSTKDEIRAILQPAQIEKYNALEAHWEARRQKRNGHRP